MAKGILGRKLGMTQIFDAAGNLVPVTIVDCSENVVLQQKTVENDGYVAVQVGVCNKKVNLSNKPEQGHVAKANTAPKRFIREFRFSEAQGNDLLSYNVGQEIKVDIFAAGDVVDVTGRQFFICQILDVFFDVWCVDFIKFGNVMMFLYIDEKVQSVIVVSFDCALAQLSEMTIQFELLQTVFC